MLTRIVFALLLFLQFSAAYCQQPDGPIGLPRGGSRIRPNTSPANNRADNGQLNVPKKDSIPFEHRDDSKDSISVSYRYLNAPARRTMDSSINDFDVFFSIPSYYQHLGNNGAAAYSLLFKPYIKPGWDAGFHSFDIYRFQLEDTKFYKTRRPFSMLGYQLASGKEQMLQAGHTQSPKPNINFGFDYKLISAPGFFVTQNNTHNASRIFGNYQGKRKRYTGTLVAQSNNIKAAQNGGIKNDSFLLDPNRKERFSVPVNLGNAASFAPSPFQTSVKTGNIYKNATIFLRQSYDFGKNDSLEINDSTKEYLFYPKFRLQHSFTYIADHYLYNDFTADSTTYQKWYSLTLNKPGIDSLFIQENWSVVRNDFSIIQFPDTKNSSQYVLAGISVENISRKASNGTNKFYNSFVHGEYRNITRNKVWDLAANGVLYLTGLNSGDYQATASISRYLNPKFGNISLNFNNTSRRPSFVFDNRSAFHLGNNLDLKKENIISVGATSNNSFINLSFNNYLITNYTYFKGFTQTDQYSKPLNILQIGASKKVKLSKRIFWYPEGVLQQTDPNGPVRLPFLYTRNRVAFEGNFFKNLFLSTGLDVRYYSPYKAYNYSPLNGQFTTQDTLTISNRPDVAAFLHFRIKGFSAFLRAENLNTVSFSPGFGFLRNNFAAPLYPTQGFMIRFGIRWWFIN